ncbi:MAG: hypothetical protein ACXAC2_00205 [Candidatus Kariarchaeaceae archaeon]|jgi:hypothetical protein
MALAETQPQSLEAYHSAGQYFLNQSLKSLNGVKIAELGKAIVAQGSKWFKTKKNFVNVVPESPDYNFETYEKMYKRIDLLHEMVNKFSESMVQSGWMIGPPDHLLQENEFVLDQNSSLKNNILFVRRWARYIKFSSWLVGFFKPGLWCGNGYTEMVPEGDERNLDVEFKTEAADRWGIIGLKEISPLEMRVVRDHTGVVLGYVQYPYNSPYPTVFSPRQANIAIDKYGAIKLEADDILHLKWNPLPSGSYGISIFEPLKDVTGNVMGIRDDLAITVNNYSIPTTHFRLGNDVIPASNKAIDTFTGYLSSLDNAADLVTSTLVESIPIKDPSKVLDIPKFLRALLNMLYASAGVPEILFGQGNETTEATAKMQMEAADKKFNAMRQLVRDQLELQLFARLIKGMTTSQLKPKDMDEIPQIYFAPFETAEDKRLRYENGVKAGSLTHQDYRRAYGFLPKREGDVVLEQDKEYQLELAKTAPPQANPFGGGTSGGGSKPSGPTKQRPSDRNKKTPTPSKK